MNVLHVNNVDLPGRRFNGYDLLEALPRRGVAAKQAVLHKYSSNSDVFSLFSGPGDHHFQAALFRVEQSRGMNDLLFPWGRVLAKTREFQAADVVHYHLIHNDMVSLLDLEFLFEAKPSVWTFHDPWPMTGHCIYPRDCEGWLQGCAACPFLGVTFPMQHDYAYRMWRIKQRVLARIDADVVVASGFMHEMVERSPLTAHLDRVHVIPFGIDLSRFLPDEEREASRRMLHIPPDDFVIFFRSVNSHFKGLPSIIEALGSHPPLRPTTLLTVDKKGLISDLSPHYNIVELGWVEDESLFPRLFSACDLFLMPSTAEAFGLMAIEAMAAGRPVVSFQGTSLPSVTHAPDCGIAVPMGDAKALRDAIDRLSSDTGELARRGRLGREIAAIEYDHEKYLDSLVSLYEKAVRRRREGEIRE